MPPDPGRRIERTSPDRGDKGQAKASPTPRPRYKISDLKAARLRPSSLRNPTNNLTRLLQCRQPTNPNLSTDPSPKLAAPPTHRRAKMRVPQPVNLSHFAETRRRS